LTGFLIFGERWIIFSFYQKLTRNIDYLVELRQTMQTLS
jgi:hypothetical protein